MCRPEIRLIYIGKSVRSIPSSKWVGVIASKVISFFSPSMQLEESKIKLLKYTHPILNVSILALREKCPNTEFFLVRIFLYSDWIQENMDQRKPPDMDTFYAVWIFGDWNLWRIKSPKNLIEVIQNNSCWPIDICFQ